MTKDDETPEEGNMKIKESRTAGNSVPRLASQNSFKKRAASSSNKSASRPSIRKRVSRKQTIGNHYMRLLREENIDLSNPKIEAMASQILTKFSNLDSILTSRIDSPTLKEMKYRVHEQEIKEEIKKCKQQELKEKRRQIAFSLVKGRGGISSGFKREDHGLKNLSSKRNEEKSSKSVTSSKKRQSVCKMTAEKDEMSSSVFAKQREFQNKNMERVKANNLEYFYEPDTEELTNRSFLMMGRFKDFAKDQVQWEVLDHLLLKEKKPERVEALINSLGMDLRAINLKILVQDIQNEMAGIQTEREKFKRESGLDEDRIIENKRHLQRILKKSRFQHKLILSAKNKGLLISHEDILHKAKSIVNSRNAMEEKSLNSANQTDIESNPIVRNSLFSQKYNDGVQGSKSLKGFSKSQRSIENGKSIGSSILHNQAQISSFRNKNELPKYREELSLPQVKNAFGNNQSSIRSINLSQPRGQSISEDKPYSKNIKLFSSKRGSQPVKTSLPISRKNSAIPSYKTKAPRPRLTPSNLPSRAPSRPPVSPPQRSSSPALTDSSRPSQKSLNIVETGIATNYKELKELQDLIQAAGQADNLDIQADLIEQAVQRFKEKQEGLLDYMKRLQHFDRA